MRKKSIKVDRITDQPANEDPVSPVIVTTTQSEDIDVKEALRTSICLKSKNKGLGNTNNIGGTAKQMVPIPVVERYNELYNSASSDNDDEESDGGRDKDKSSGKNSRQEDEQSATIRRERNRLAAQRCRQRRRDRIDKLEKICQKLELDGSHLQMEITELQKEMNDLQGILSNHKCILSPLVKTELFIPSVKRMDNKMFGGGRPSSYS